MLKSLGGLKGVFKECLLTNLYLIWSQFQLVIASHLKYTEIWYCYLENQLLHF